MLLLKVERAQFFQVRAELGLFVSNPDESELVKISLEPALSPSFSLITTKNAQFKPTLSLSEILARVASSPSPGWLQL